jgi:esterase/lipase superfamily enzyme
MRLKDLASALVGIAIATFLSACSPQDALAPTPSIYAGPQATALIKTPRLNGGDDLGLVYVTDRAPMADPATGALSYGAGRSPFMSFGTVDVDITPSTRTDAGKLKLGAPTEVGRFPEGPYATEPTPKGVRRAPKSSSRTRARSPNFRAKSVSASQRRSARRSWSSSVATTTPSTTLQEPCRRVSSGQK